MKNRIRELRNELDLTAKDIGEKLGVSERAVRLYEKADRDISTETLRILSKTFDCSFEYILCQYNERKKKYLPSEYMEVLISAIEKEIPAQEIRDYIKYK